MTNQMIGINVTKILKIVEDLQKDMKKLLKRFPETKEEKKISGIRGKERNKEVSQRAS